MVRHQGKAQAAQQRAVEHLASGLRINRAADDVSGLSVATNFKAQLRSYGAARQNVTQGISLVQTAEASLNEIAGIVTRLRELAMQSATGTVTDDQRAMINLEFSRLKDEIDRIVDSTEFNGLLLLNGDLAAGGAGSPTPAETTAPISQTAPLDKKEKIQFEDYGLFAGLSGSDRQIFINAGTTQAGVVAAINGDPVIGARVTASINGSGQLVLTSVDDGDSAIFRVSSNRAAAADSTGLGQSALTGSGSSGEASQGLMFQVGIGGDEPSRIYVSIDSVRAQDLGLDLAVVSNADSARDALALLDAAVNYVSTVRGTLGAAANRLGHAQDLLMTSAETTLASKSRIEDLDVAEGASNYARRSITSSVGAALLAQSRRDTLSAFQQILSSSGNILAKAA
jgi:flagellin